MKVYSVHNQPFVGEVIPLRSGICVVVKDIQSGYATLEDEIGNSKNVHVSHLSSEKTNWFVDALLRHPERQYVQGARTTVYIAGTTFVSRKGVWCDVVECFKDHCLVKFLSTGNTQIVSKRGLSSGLFADEADKTLKKSLKVRTPRNAPKRYKVGEKGWSKFDGAFEIVELVKRGHVKIRWDGTDIIQKVETRHINDETLKKPKPKLPQGSYVYLVKQSDEIVYIGSGKGHRFRHPNSGKSSCRMLNYHHFAGVIFDIEIYKDGLSPKDAEALEMELICEMNPPYNTHKS